MSAGGAGGTLAGGSAGSGATMTSALGVDGLQFQVLTVTLNGKYSPKNIGAIWIETSGGKFVKTLEVWAGIRARWLARWRSEAGSNRVDAVSSATLPNHVTHHASWNLTDVNRTPVAAGAYKVVVEMTDHDGTGDSTEVPFSLADPLMQAPSDAAHFVDMALTVQ
jgi:hypothetical protein